MPARLAALLSRAPARSPLATLSGAATPRPAPPPQRPGRRAVFALTVDSIMRGPNLVGYPPTGLRWSGDCTRLYFEWRQPGEDEASTWVVGARRRAPAQAIRRRDGDRAAGRRRVGQSAPARRCSLDRRRHRPDRHGRAAPARRSRARPAPRRLRAGRATRPHVTFVRDNDLFLVPLDGAAAWYADRPTSGPKKPIRGRPTARSSSRPKRQKLIEHVREEAEKKKATRSGEKAPRCRSSSSASASRPPICSSSPDGKLRVLLVVERPETAKTAERARTTSPNRATPTTSRRGPRSATPRTKRRSPCCDLQTRQDRLGRLATAPERTPAAAPTRPSERRRERSTGRGECRRELRWSMPQSSDGWRAGRRRRPRATTRIAGSSRVDPGDRASRGRSITCTTMPGCASGASAGGGPSFGWLPDRSTLWFLSERDGWMHLYVVDADGRRRRARRS